MIQKNPFLKYLVKEQMPDVVHSSVYAKAQNENGIGAASTESYEVRVKIDKNRQKIRGYRDSGLINDAKMNTSKARAYTATESEKALGEIRGGMNTENAGPVNNTDVAFKRAAMSRNSTLSGAPSRRGMATVKNPGISVKK